MTEALVLKRFGISKSNLVYSQATNAFLSTGYTSAAGNTYFNAVRFAEGIVINEDIGKGWAHTFLNGIKIYSLRNKELLAERYFYSNIYSKAKVKNEAIDMLFEVLKIAAEREGHILNHTQAKNAIANIIEKAMSSDQIKIIQDQSRKYLSA